MHAYKPVSWTLRASHMPVLAVYTHISDFAVASEGSPEINDKTVLETSSSTAHNWPGRATSLFLEKFRELYCRGISAIIEFGCFFYFFFASGLFLAIFFSLRFFIESRFC